MAGIYVITLFVAAWLLFGIQPMVGRLLLPKLGGSPAVWNTCLVFFQGMLLLGYLYGHVMPKWLGVRRHAVVHFLLLAGVFFTLPTVLRGGDPPDESPALWLLGALVISVGLPFFALATTSPLLQKWYAVRRGRDPYFLSVASNAGSLALLLAYPLLIEPQFDLPEQADLWRWGYLGFVILAGLCVSMVRSGPPVEPNPTPATETPQTGGPAWRWVALAFIPSSLLSGVTNSITTDVAPIPLLWVVPLALYLLTFIIAFAPIRLPMKFFGRLAVLGTITLSLALLAGATEPLGLVLAIHLGGFFSMAMLCHARLSLERPAADDLTRYYLLMSLGGVLGGAFNALVAPVLFHRLGVAEYPLMIVAACLVRPAEWKHLQWRWNDLLAPLILGVIVAGAVLLGQTAAVTSQFQSFGESTGIPGEMLKTGALFGLPLIICYFFVDRPVRFALGIGAVMLAGAFHDGAQGKAMLIERNFLGVVKITTSTDGEFTKMVHGNTVHGQQRNAARPKWIASYLLPVASPSPMHEATTVALLEDRWDDRHQPLTYYHPNGPVGSVFRQLVSGWKRPRRIGAVGLGTGALASYARANETWTFFELDPAVEKLARDERYFTYLKNSKAAKQDVVLGDARLKLMDEPDGSFDLLVLDAFSSDSIPLHLLTMEAFELYERKLAPNGIILMHLSNRYLDLPPMVAKIGATLSPPMVVRLDDDSGLKDRDKEDGKFASVWVIVARTDADFGPLQKPISGWTPAPVTKARAWTDRRTNLMDVLRRGSED
ncbi:spermidine synthase [Zavarzinella formosa]|uniref:spermidine synthase n=1 Tax=Zavarzinella formosa TaxID=360055 RepID=UPI0002FD2FE0|nr:fused MFS/spermidine synthase [Zavarzinella formosa]